MKILNQDGKDDGVIESGQIAEELNRLLHKLRSHH